jgi:hypothetical protein
VLIVLLSACGNPEGEDVTPSPPVPEPTPTPTPAPVVLIDECDPSVRIPGILGAVDLTPPDEHQEVYGPLPVPQQVRLNWPSSDPSDSVAFLWRTDVDTLATVVEYGVGGELTERVEGASFRYGGALGEPGPQRIHEVKLCGELTPGTTYSYRVGGGGYWSPVYTFTTPGPPMPAPGASETVRIAIAGDSRGAYETWAALLDAIEQHEPDMVLFTGDMVEFGANQAEWDAWFTATGDMMARIPFVPAHGNHEFMAPHYFAQWSLPGNEQWYSLRYGPLELAVLNDTTGNLADITGPQVDFLDEVFGDSTATWRLAMHHQSLYATCTRHGSNETLRAAWGPKYDEYGLQLALAGHNHIYERSIPILADQPAPEGQGTTYLVTGGAGATLYRDFEEDWFGLVANPVEHYVILDLGPTQGVAVVRDLAGNVIDQFTLLP